MKVADFHAHVFPDKLADKAAGSIGDFYGVQITRTASVDMLVQEEKKAGISRCVVSNSAVTPRQVHNVNDFISAAVAAHPNFIGFGSIFPGMDGAEDELDRMLSLGLRGIKIHPDFQKLAIDDPSGIETYRAIARRGLPVLFHMGDYRYDFSSPERLTNLLRKVPDLQVIAAHFGAWGAWEQSLAHPQPENVLYDTSSSLPMADHDLILRLFDKLGTERFLFGSDFPMWSPKQELERFLALGFDEATNETILYGNFMKLFGLHDDGET